MDCKGDEAKGHLEVYEANSEQLMNEKRRRRKDWEKSRKTKEPTMKESKDGRNTEYVNVF